MGKKENRISINDETLFGKNNYGIGTISNSQSSSTIQALLCYSACKSECSSSCGSKCASKCSSQCWSICSGGADDALEIYYENTDLINL